jgi:LysM repeat protein
MKNKFLPTAFAALALAVLPCTVSAQAITYLMMDKLCVTKHDYQRTKGNAVDFYEFYVYMPAQKGRKVIMRIPKLENMYIAKFKNLEPNARVINCSNLEQLTPEFINNVNIGQSTIYVIEANGTDGYFGYQVGEINELVEEENKLTYQDKRTNFEYSYDKIYPPNTNLSSQKGKVVYQNIRKEQCQHIREFRAYSTVSNEPPSTIFIMEGIGIQKIAYNGSEVELKTVNGVLLSKYAEDVCNGNNKPTKPVTPPKTNTTAEKPMGANGSIFGSGKKIAADTSKTVVNPTVDFPTNNDNKFTSRGGDKDPKKIKKTAIAPPKEVPPGYHVVSDGENLYNIAQQYGTTVNRIKYWNNLTSDKIDINQLLKVIDDGTNPYQGNNPTIEEDISQGVRLTIHTVEQNDMLGTLAKRYNTTVKSLYELNELPNDFLQIGQKIIISVELLSN